MKASEIAELRKQLLKLNDMVVEYFNLVNVLQERLVDADENIVGLLRQSCGDYDEATKEYTFDSRCLSSYEAALSYAVRYELIPKDKVIR